MSYRVEVLCRPATAAGFALAGFRPVEAETPIEGAERLTVMTAQPGLGVVLIEEPLYRALSEEKRRQIAARPLPLIVPFPGPPWGGAVEGPDRYIVELLRQAIGYRVRLT